MIQQRTTVIQMVELEQVKGQQQREYATDRYDGQPKCESQQAGRSQERAKTSLRLGEKEKQLINECLLNTRPTGKSIQKIIDGLDGIWKRLTCSLTLFAKYWDQQEGTVLQPSTLEQPCLIIAIQITYLKPLESDVQFNELHKKQVIEQLMNEHVDSVVKAIKEIKYWKLSQIIQFISTQETSRDESRLSSDQLMKKSLTLIMVQIVLRIVEVQRAEQQIENINKGEIVVATMIMKMQRGPVEKTLKAVHDITACSFRWIQS
ncbi:MAG: hypothetical protein EZS28_001421 [Streblomastix strix]|uniref:Uncharacterized protein n=1 Tax=Streblomastix strix TaxID=222440 RepID=A0A5J4X7P2_9EUKA|nr:MAG: hypothetical protein EZS28_001421 [Streblomastix strix]